MPDINCKRCKQRYLAHPDGESRCPACSETNPEPARLAAPFSKESRVTAFVFVEPIVVLVGLCFIVWGTGIVQAGRNCEGWTCLGSSMPILFGGMIASFGMMLVAIGITLAILGFLVRKRRPGSKVNDKAV